MRVSSIIAALLLGLGLGLGQQPAANSADAGAEANAWQAQVAGAPPAAHAVRAAISPDDPSAVLDAMDYALTEVADGATYIWHRVDGPLQGAVKPVASFRSATGALCRRLSVTLTLGEDTRWTEATACRDAAGRWEVGG